MTTPVLVLTTTSQRGGVQASVLLDPSSSMAGGAGPWSSLQLSSLHSLAQANLISDTQQQIARQLSAQGQAEEEKGKKEKRTKFGVRAVQKSSSKIKFANGEWLEQVLVCQWWVTGTGPSLPVVSDWNRS